MDSEGEDVFVLAKRLRGRHLGLGGQLRFGPAVGWNIRVYELHRHSSSKRHVRGRRRGSVLVTGYCRGEVEVDGTCYQCPAFTTYNNGLVTDGYVARWQRRGGGTGSAGSAARTW